MARFVLWLRNDLLIKETRGLFAYGEEIEQTIRFSSVISTNYTKSGNTPFCNKNVA